MSDSVLAEELTQTSRPRDRRVEARRFTLFVLLGGGAALVNWLSRFAFSAVMPFQAAVIVAYLCGMVVAFILFRRFVFPTSPLPLKRQITAFVVVNLFGIAQVWAVSLALVTYALPALGLEGELWRGVAHGIAIGVPTISSYIGHRFFTFAGADG